MHLVDIRYRWLHAAMGLAFVAQGSFVFAATPASGIKRVSASTHFTSLQEVAETSSLVDGWHEYALSTLKSNFTWASEPGEAIEPPSVFNRGRSSFARAPTVRFPGAWIDDSRPLHFSIQSTRVADTPLFVSGEASSLLPDSSPGMRRTVIAPSFTQHVGETGSMRLSAIFAYQKLAGFSTTGLDTPQTAQELLLPNLLSTPIAQRANETAFGLGARVDFSNAFTDRLGWSAGYQSQVNLDGFENYRSVFGRPGDFDIPASVNAALGFALTPQLRLNVGVDRVMYSQTEPFISRDFPSLALALLNRGRFSQTMQWEDLNVYSVGLGWHHRIFGDFGLTYTTRQQPLPTSLALSQFFEPYVSSRNWEFDYAHSIGENGLLRFSATYAPIQLLDPSLTYNLTSADGYPNGISTIRYETLITYKF